jgi:hypothetical protein
VPLPALRSAWGRFYAGLIGFAEQYFGSPSVPGVGTPRLDAAAARRLRYAVFWAHYEGTVYRRMHSWAAPLKAAYQLYSYTRTIYSPAYRLGEFWATHVYTGTVDPDAGDGKARPSSIPIVADNDAIRPAIALIWRRSNWQLNVQKWVRYGAVMGETALRIVDDPARRAVYLEVVHPSEVSFVRIDPFGNVKEYAIEELRPDPDDDPESPITNLVLYREECKKSPDGNSVTFRTFLDGDPYDWRDYPDDTSERVGPEWSVPYGFVPLVWTKHRDTGGGVGWPELHPVLSKVHELDDVGSKLNDQVRKTVEAAWFFAGLNAADVTIAKSEPSASDPEPGRQETPTLVTPEPNARAYPLVAPLDIAGVLAVLDRIGQSIEADFPELQADMDTASGDASGRALRVARQRAEAKVSSVRPIYDDGQVRAIKMALSIGAIRGYPGFESIPPDAYALGLLDFSIGDRPVFAVDPLDRLEERQAEANALKTYVDAGVPVDEAMRRLGWSGESVDAALAAREAEADRKVLTIRRQQAAFGVVSDREDVVPAVGQ